MVNEKVMKKNNIILLLALSILLVVGGCYLLLFAPDYYRGDTQFFTIEEYNKYLLVIGEEPVEKFTPIHICTDIILPRSQRSQGYPYGERPGLDTAIGFTCLGASLIFLACLAYELRTK